MLIYEKDNKLNINFENSVEETPDLQISKEDGKTSITVDGQQGGGGGGIEPVIVTVNLTSETGRTWSGATWEELKNAFMHNVAGINLGDGDIRWFSYFTRYNETIALCSDAPNALVPLRVMCVSDGTLIIETLR